MRPDIRNDLVFSPQPDLKSNFVAEERKSDPQVLGDQFS